MQIFNKNILLFILVFLSALGMRGMNVLFPETTHKIISISPDKKTGLNNIYVVYNVAELPYIEIRNVTSNISIQRFSNMGGGYAEDVNFRKDGSTAYVDNPTGDMGYIISDGSVSQYIWIVDYSQHRFTLSGVVAEEIQECDNTRFTIIGECGPITYFTIDGRPEELSRDIKVSYTTLEWDENDLSYNRENVEKNYSSISHYLTLIPPLYCSTELKVTGDRFLEEWKERIEVMTSTILPNGLEIHTTAEQTNLPDENDEDYLSNVISAEGAGLGGSAPAIIKFTSYSTEAVIHHEWQMTRDPQFENIEYRFNDKEIEYTFNEEGQYFVRFVGSNSDGSCEVYGDTYTVNIGASELRIPNAFSPNDDGVNDIWKVGYRSLISFKCWIMDRYGNQIYYFEDPNQGWDGRFNGKKVKGGVYFYVIEAKGADGKKYKKGGDINIVTRKNSSTGIAED